ncbi:unnamed protein product [Clavelina lepadiformis]
MLGFMLTSFFLSMWISNTATTAMMLPIVEAVFKELKADGERNLAKRNKAKINNIDEITRKKSGSNGTGFTSFHSNEAYKVDVAEKENKEKSSSNTDRGETESDEVITVEDDGPHETEDQFRKRMDNLIKGITLSVPYSASIGGTSTLTGTAPNLILSGQIEVLFPDASQQLSFGTWIVYCLPGALIILVFGYIWLSTYFLGFNPREICACIAGGEETEGEKNAKKVINVEYKKLGSIKWNELTVLTIFIFTALLWFFRDPGFMPGWTIIFLDGYVTDGTVAMTMAFLLFILPEEKPSFLRKKDKRYEDGIRRPYPSIMNWKIIHTKFPWDILFLLCGGFALADGAVESGFSAWMGQQLAFLGGIPDWAICLVVTIIVCLFTECSSNTATASLFVPILAELAQTIQVHPFYLMIPPVLASSLAFMLPVATPPNAIAFSYGHLKVIDLIKAGWMMNIIGIVVITILINTFGMAFFNLSTYPDWAKPPLEDATTAITNATLAKEIVHYIYNEPRN